VFVARGWSRVYTKNGLVHVVGNVCRDNLRDVAVRRTFCLDQLGRRPPLLRVTVLKRRVVVFFGRGCTVPCLHFGGIMWWEILLGIKTM